MITEPYIHVLYCEDIRREDNGKLMFIGAYASIMLVSQFPVTIPKFCVAAWISMPPDKIPQKLRLRVTLEEEVLANWESDIEVEEALFSGKVAEMAKSRGGGAAVMAAPMLTLPPFVVTEPSMMSVRCWMDDEEYRGPALVIMARPADDAPPPPMPE